MTDRYDESWQEYRCTDCDPDLADLDADDAEPLEWDKPYVMLVPEGEAAPDYCPRCSAYLSMHAGDRELQIRNTPAERYAAERSNGEPDQLGLGPFQRHSETSRKAAIDNYPRSGSQRCRVLTAILHAADGLTREEIGRRIRLSGDSVRPRVAELVEGGWVREDTKTRLTLSGSEASVLRPTEKATSYEAKLFA